MTNIDIIVKDNKLTIEVDLQQEHGKSKTGKSTIVGTTHGFMGMADSKGNQFSVSVNVIKK